MLPHDSSRKHLQPFEPLEKSAPLAWAMAPSMCHQDPETGTNCAWYHGLWQYLRQIGILTAVRSDSAFLFDTLENLARQGNFQRILIAGAADYSMLAHVAAAYGNQGVKPQISVVDRCETPLFFSRWYAGEISIPIRTCRSNIFEYTVNRPFDLLCSHSFLWHIAPHLRSGLMRKWRSLIRQGGKIVTSQLVYAGSEGQWFDDIDRKSEEFRDRVIKAASKHGYLPGITPEALGKAAAIFRFGTIRERHTMTAEEVVDLFKSHNFLIEKVEKGSFRGAQLDLNAKPSDSEPERLRVIAV